MSNRNSYIDHQALASQYSVGDLVRKVDAVRGKEFVNLLEGRVEAVYVGIGFVDVAFPWGTDRMSPDLLMKVEGPPAIAGDYLDAHNRRGASLVTRVASSHVQSTSHVHETANRMRQVGFSEMDAYMMLSSKYASSLGDGVARDAVTLAYEKTALYWKETGRRYVPSQLELDQGIYKCPRCREDMGQTVYKKNERLYACRGCLFLIKPCDIVNCGVFEESPEEAMSLKGLEDFNVNS